MTFTDNTRGIIFMAVAMATFTVNDSFMKAVTQVLPLSEAIVIRGVMTLAALLVLAWAMGMKSIWISPDDRALLGWRTAAELGATITFLLALRQMPLANLSAIMQSLPLAVTLGAAIALKEPVGWRRMTAIAVGFAGVLLIVRPGTDGFNIWSVVALISVAFVVVRDLTTRQFSTGLPSVTIAIYTSIAVTLMGLSGLAIEEWTPVEPQVLAMLAGASVMLILGYLFIVMAMRVGDVGVVAPFRYSALIWAILLGWLVFDDFPRGLTLLGAAIIVATGLYTYLREHQLQRRISASRASLTGTATPDR
ncbi:DMT family transporter [Pseudorhodobacter sp.]|uniref:DMT family transporter n=1 Tax=Pseudorhodobacter sp. TaxID=1934400 RepID=UPI002AFDEE20|nr:DMT family transporter [Pseudorhodobacter sp.]